MCGSELHIHRLGRDNVACNKLREKRTASLILIKPRCGGHVKFKYHEYLLLQLPQIFKMAAHYARRCAGDIKIIIRAKRNYFYGEFFPAQFVTNFTDI